ncbi:MAG: glycosyltransferase [Candidatus Cloacimonadales bacterium]
MNKLLMISYFAPPLNTPAAIRVGKFAQYLPQYGWQATILTVKELDYYQAEPELYNLSAQKIVRTESADPLRLLKIFSKNKPATTAAKSVSQNLHQKGESLTNRLKALFPVDDKIGWLPFCYAAGKKILRRDNYQAIYCTLGGTNAQAIAAYKLAKKFQLPLILDIRDPWTDHIFTNYNWYNKILNNYWEQKILKFADKIITVTAGIKSTLDKKYDFPAAKLEVIYNGFDNFWPATKAEKDDFFTLTFAGNMYKDITPQVLLQALQNLPREILKQHKIRLRFIGNFRNTFHKLIAEFRANRQADLQLEILPFMPKQELSKYLHSSDLLLIFLPKRAGAAEILTTKFFDYLPYKKPLLAIAPEPGELADFILENNLGFVIDPEEKQPEKKLRQILQLRQENQLANYQASEQFIGKYRRENLTKKLADVLTEMCKPTQPARKKIAHLQLLPLLSGVQNVMLEILADLDQEKYEISVISKSGGPLLEKLHTLGYRHIPLESLRREISWWDFVALFRLWRIFRTEKFQIVHTHSSKPGFLGRIAARLAGVPRIIHTVHGLPFHPYSPPIIRFIYRHLEKLAARFCDFVVFVNRSERILAEQQKIVKPQQAITIFNGIDLPQNYPRKTDHQRFVVGSCLRFWQQKNIIATLKAAIEVCQRQPQIDFIFIGDGDEYQQALDLVQQAGLSQRISLPGWQDKVQAWFEKFDLFLLYSKWEGLPISILEAMAYGLPIVASDIKGNNELVTAANGVLISVQQPQKLVEEIISLSRQPEKLQVWGENSRKLVAEKFSLAQFNRQYQALYEE